jgi:hypothetical protein
MTLELHVPLAAVLIDSTDIISSGDDSVCSRCSIRDASILPRGAKAPDPSAQRHQSHSHSHDTIAAD